MIQQDEQELQLMLEAQRKTELLLSLPLYSNKMTSWKWVCGKCYDETYYSTYITRKKS
jgi:hypothetical protein